MMGLLTGIFAALAQTLCLLPPVDAAIAEPFVEPACPYCPGHRGVEYVVDPGTPVRAAAAGTVTFAGVVAGTRYVIIEQANGLTATYGMLVSSPLDEGDGVVAGQVVARSGPRFYFGLRIGDTYVDPQDFIGVVRRRPRLIPSSGLAGRPARALPPTCPAAGSTR